MEFFDIRNPDGTITGEIKERSLVHRDGDLHGTVHIFILRRREGVLELLLQKRTMDKDAFPGCYDVSAAGHISAGQDYPEAAARELEEELGLHAEEEDLHFIGYIEGYDEEIFHGKPFRNHELIGVYLYLKEVRTEDLILQEEEVDEVRWMPFSLCLEKAEQKAEGYCLFPEEFAMVIPFVSGEQRLI